MARRSDPALVITCEHGGNRVPARYRALFARQRELLHSHRGHDPGAAQLAVDLGVAFGVTPHIGRVTRLLIELNRSPHHPRLFSALTRDLPGEERARILAEHWQPYRSAVEREIDAHLRRGRQVVHIAAHSFTPVLDGDVRRADVGLLYDPRRRLERELCARWAHLLRATGSAQPPLRVRRNYPYRGASDGFTTWLRRRCGTAYCGIEVEINQARLADRQAAREIRQRVVDALAACLPASHHSRFGEGPGDRR